MRRGRLKPGALWIVDLERGALFADREVECEIASRRPYGTWAAEATIRLEDVAARRAAAAARGVARAAADRLRLYPRGPGDPDRPDGRDGQGADRLDGRRRRAARAFATRAPPLFSYFKQRFAQVTNPAIDSLREDLVMS